MNEEDGKPKIYGVVSDLKNFRSGEIPPRSKKFITAGPACLGLAILLGGQPRFTHLTTAGGLAPWWAWGVSFCLATAIMVPYAYFNSQHYFWPTIAAAVLFFFWALCLLYQTHLSGNNSFTGAAFYGWYGVCIAGISSRDEKKLWPFRR